MTAKHTPSPWICEGITRDGDFAIYNEKTFEEVLDIHTGTIHEKNLPLILAAPEMYEALVNVLDSWSEGYRFNEDHDVCESAYKALAKARGEK